MAGGAHPGRPRVRMRASRDTSSSGGVDRSMWARRRRNRMPGLRPLLRRALRLARHIEHLSAVVGATRAGPRVPHLDERIASARAPKRLAAITRLARLPAPARVPDSPAWPTRSSRTPARPISISRDVAPVSPEAGEALETTRVESLFAEALPEPEVKHTPAAPRLLRAPPQPPPPDLPEDMRFLWDVWQREKPGGRGVLERGRGARIMEGSAPQSGPPAGDRAQVSRVTAQPTPVASSHRGQANSPRR